MTKFDAQDKQVAEIFSKVMIKKDQKRKEWEKNTRDEAFADLDKLFWKFLPGRLKNIVSDTAALETTKGLYSKAQIDALKRGVSDLLTLTRMYTEPEVIAQLTNEAVEKLLRKRMKDKMLEVKAND